MQRTQSICLIVLTIIAVGFSLYYLQSVLLPFVIALFVVIGCRPILEYFERRLKLPRIPAFGLTFFIGFLLLSVFGFLTWVSINDVSRNADAYEARLGAIATWVSEQADNWNDQVEPLGPPAPNPDDVSVPDDELPDVAEQESPDPAEAIQDLWNAVAKHLQQALLSLAGSLSTILSYGVLIVIFVFFLLIGNEENYEQRPRLLVDIESQVRKYLVMKTVISLITGLIFGAILWFFGVPLAILFGFLAFLLNYIPNIGPLISNLLPVPFLVLNSEMSIAAAIICFVLISAVVFISGNVIETRMMGQSFDVSPVVLLLSLMFFGLVWGIVGMFLATPLVSIVKIILQQTPGGEPWAELLAGRWSTGTTSTA